MNAALTPISGSGSRQQFAFGVQKGAESISWVQMLINGQWTGLGGCYVHYNASANFLWLFDDRAQGGAGVTPGSSGVVENGQCVLRGKGSSVSVLGKTLEVIVDVTFKPGFEGTKNVYMQAGDLSNQLAPWVRAGTWNATGYPNLPKMISLTPSSGDDPRTTLRAVYHVPNGAAWAQILVSSDVSAVNSCYISYYPATKTFRLFSDSVSGYASIAEGSQGSIENSQCALVGKDSTARFSGGDLAVTVDLRLKPAFRGLKQIRLQTMDLQGYYAPWAVMGAWSRP